MKKITRSICLIVCTTFFANTALPAQFDLTTTQVREVKNERIKNITDVFDRFEYDMTVAWDGKNESVKEDATARFKDGLSDLVKAGFDPSEIQDHME